MSDGENQVLAHFMGWITATCAFAYAVGVWQVWILPIGLGVLLLLWLWRVSAGFREAGKAVGEILLRKSKRDKFLITLIHTLGYSALMFVVVAVAWSGLIQMTERGFSWRAREYWRAQCLGMKTVGITGVPLDNFLKYAPRISGLSHQAELGERREAVTELQTSSIIRNDVPPKEVAPGFVIQETHATFLGQQVCRYYLTDYRRPPNE